MNLHGFKIILGSNSPRRSELLKLLDLPFEKRAIEVDESLGGMIKPEDAAEFIARKKASVHKDKLRSDEIVITADTVVVLDGIIYGKPKDREDAINILLQLSGKIHYVYTGVVLLSNKKESSFTEVTKVFFEELTLEEAEYYFDNFNPVDKAGAYGIQDWIGYSKVKKIEGSYSNIIGLPTARLYKELAAFVKHK